MATPQDSRVKNSPSEALVVGEEEYTLTEFDLPNPTHEDQQEFRKQGYDQDRAEITFWLGLRESLLRVAWEDFKWLLAGIVFQTGIGFPPLVTVIFYLVVFYWDLFVKRWNRYNAKVKEEGTKRLKSEKEQRVFGSEHRAGLAPKVGVKEDTQYEVILLEIGTIVIGTIAWAFRFAQYEWWINAICGIFCAIAVVKGTISVFSLQHERVRFIQETQESKQEQSN